MAERIGYRQPYSVEGETQEDAAEQLSVAERKMQVARRLAATFTKCVQQCDTGEFGYRKLYPHLYDLNQLQTESSEPSETPIDDKIGSAVARWQQSRQGAAQHAGAWEVVARSAWDIRNALDELDQPPLPEDE